MRKVGIWRLFFVILKPAKGQKNEDLSRMFNLSMDDLQRELRGELVQKKYMIVLDDIWTEVRDEWITLMGFLSGGLRGSWVIATTRSKITATIIGGGTHDLKGLSDDDSMLLFEKVAFGQDEVEANRLALGEIGRDIVNKYCSNVPLAIRVVAAALYGQQRKKRLLFRDVGLRRVMKGTNDIEPILKLSYLHLDPQLRRCFIQCSLFPKGSQMEKWELIYFWIAQGYVVPWDEAQTIEDAGEEYFLTLLKRCFFQDTERDEHGEIICFKIHDLMHDIAQNVVEEEIIRVDSGPSNLNNKFRYISHNGWGEGTKSFFTSSKVRTYCGDWEGRPNLPVEFCSVLAKWRSLRVLTLNNSGMRNLPIMLDKLQHLRYLDLDRNQQLEVLPNSVTKLHNLQVLYLRWCFNLKHLPNDLGKLTSLRVLGLEDCNCLKELPRDLGTMTSLKVLDTTGCDSLSHMPRGMGKLSYLWKLPYFVLGEGTPSNERFQLADHIEEIRALQNLKGKLHLQINNPDNAEYVVGNGGEGVPLTLSPYLTEIGFVFPFSWERRTGDYEIDEKLLEGLKPHPNLTELKLVGYLGGIMPNWARGGENLAVFLPNLVSIDLLLCKKLQLLPLFGKLPQLKSLVLAALVDLEYMENTTMSRKNDSSVDELFFHSLERLKLSNLLNLQGWWGDDGNSSQEDGDLSSPSFPCLSHLEIHLCPNLTIMPLCTSSLENLEIDAVPDLNLRMIGISRLKSVRTDNIELLKLGSPTDGYSCLERLFIWNDIKVEKLAEVEEEFRSCSASLQELEIRYCDNLKSVCGGLEHLTALERLKLGGLSDLSLSKTEGGGERERERRKM